jgi:hypothetical protein
VLTAREITRTVKSELHGRRKSVDSRYTLYHRLGPEGHQMETQQDPELDQGPYLAAAILCETLLREEGGVLSLIRVIDQVTITAPQEVLASGQPIPYKTVLVISFRAGAFEGPATIGYRAVGPSGTVVVGPSGVTTERRDYPVLFEGRSRGPNTGVNFNVEITLGLTEPGPYWFDIFLDDERVTRVPLQVVLEQTPSSDRE